MTIQFQCPACRQPIEVDDEWASRLVACPYCRKSVTAPETSTLTPEPQIPTAAPVAPTSSMADDEVSRRSASASNPYAPWALGLSCLALFLLIAVNVPIGMRIAANVGPDASPEEVRAALIDLQKELIDQIEAGEFPTWAIGLMVVMFLAGLAWVASIVLAILALRRPTRRRTSVAALIVSGIWPLMICLNPGL